ncbi:MAG: universal stress protein [Anaerolineae bacterium]|nr:universal stress protein [Anaerolineae bacterium]
MFKHILVPLDQSELAEAALSYASKLVDENGQITLLSAVEPSGFFVGAAAPATATGTSSTGMSQPGMPPVVVTAGDEPRDRHQAVTDYLKQVALRLQTPKYDVDYTVPDGSPADAIIDAVKSMNVDLVVMSTHGRSGVGRWLMGSVTQKVLGAAPCPVMAIPNRNL